MSVRRVLPAVVWGGLASGCVEPAPVLWLDETGGAGGPTSDAGTTLDSTADTTAETAAETAADTTVGTTTGTAASESSGADESTEDSTGEPLACVLEDAFEDAAAGAVWSDITVGGDVTVALGGEMTFSIPADTTDHYAGLLSDPVDVTDRAVRIRMIEPPTPGSAVQFFLGVRESEDGPRWDIMIDEGFRPRLNDPDVGADELANVPFSASDTPWVQTRFEGTEVVFERSADGDAWEEVARADNTITLTAARIALVAGTWNPNPDPLTVQIDDVSACPP